jgi:hypothetical protein
MFGTEISMQAIYTPALSQQHKESLMVRTQQENGTVELGTGFSMQAMCMSTLKVVQTCSS